MCARRNNKGQRKKDITQEIPTKIQPSKNQKDSVDTTTTKTEEETEEKIEKDLCIKINIKIIKVKSIY